MRVKLILATLGILIICFLPGCQDMISKQQMDRLEADLAQAQADLTEAQAKVAEFEPELGVEQAATLEAQKQLEAYQARIIELEKELQTCQVKLVAAMEPPPPPQPRFPLQEFNFVYKGSECNDTQVYVAMLNAVWDSNRLTVSWELTNNSDRKILLDRLSIEAYDQMESKGESSFKSAEAPVAIYPSLQNTLKLWPGSTVSFDSVWTFGPRSEVITIKFIAAPCIVEILDQVYTIPQGSVGVAFTVTRL